MQPAGRSAVTDLALQSNSLSVSEAPSRAKVLVRLRRADDLFRILTRSVSTSSTVWSARKVVTVLVEIDPCVVPDCVCVSGCACAANKATGLSDAA